MAGPATTVNITTQTTTVCKGGQASATITADTATDSTLRNISDPSFFTTAASQSPIFLTGTNITTGTFLLGYNGPQLLFQFTATTTNASTALTNSLVPANFGTLPANGLFVTGTNIAAGSTLTGSTLSIAATGSGTTVEKVWSFNPVGASAQLSAASTGTATGTTYTLFASTPGVLWGVDINTPTATTVITVFDAPVAGGRIIGKQTVAASPLGPWQWLKYPNGIILNNGLTVLTATANSDITIAFS